MAAVAPASRCLCAKSVIWIDEIPRAPHACCVQLLNLFATFFWPAACPAQPASAQGSAIQKKFAALYQAATKEGEVIYYTDGRQDEAQRLSDYWKANFPAVNLRIVPKSSPALIAQIETERAAGQHRVDASHMSQPYVAALWKQKGFYQPYKTASFERLRPDNADCGRRLLHPRRLRLAGRLQHQRVQGQGAAAARA